MRAHPSEMPIQPAKTRDGVYREFYQESTAERINTDVVVVEAIRKQYPELHLTITPRYSCDLLGYAASGHAQAVPTDADDSTSATLKWHIYFPPAHRADKSMGAIAESVQFGKYLYTWKEQDYIVYIVNGERSLYPAPMTYILGSSKESTKSLLRAASQWLVEIHDEVLIFDGGYWKKSMELWQSVRHAFWDDVIMDPDMKKAIIGVVDQFFNAKERYQKLKVPWKRGIIYHGPPGNGKTISIKAMMHSLYDRPDPIPTLYVRSLRSFQGPEWSIQQIFIKARQMAPCFLVFEDLDSIITDNVRSYFLNEVDGLESNDGILMLGSTNHLDRLDPGLAKRPSRFDRKYYFPNPDFHERELYSEYWRAKLSENKDIEFPDRLNQAVASITKDFSFAYIQEAFVASLLAIAGEGGDEQSKEVALERADDVEFPEAAGDPNLAESDDLDKYVLWRQMKKQVKILRDEMEEKNKVGERFKMDRSLLERFVSRSKCWDLE